MAKKLPSRSPGRKSNPKTESATKLRKASGSNQPMDGKGSRGTSAPKLRPSTADATWSREGLKNDPSTSRPMDGNSGTKTGS